MSTTKLTATQIRSLLSRLNDELGKADQRRIQALLETHNTPNLNYATAINTLFPDQAQEKAQNSFRSFRNRLNNAAEEIGVLLKLEVDSNKRSEASDRECWFEGEDSKVAQIAQYSSEEASDQNKGNLVPARGRIVSKGTKDEKPLIELFISYARKDNKDTNKVNSFFEELNECFKASKNFRYKLWADWEILIGEEWHDEILGALNKCDFGLMMVSLPFINSDYIDQHELPRLLNTGRALPVAFSKFDINGFDLKGLKPQQIFRHNDKFYSQFTGARKSDFIHALFSNIEQRIQKTRKEGAELSDKLNTLNPTDLKEASEAEQASCSEATITKHVKDQADKGFDPNYTAGRGRPVGIKTVPDLIEKEKIVADENAVIATDYLMDWASKEDSPPFCAVLGEYGMGKTTTLKAFTRLLLEQRPEDPSLPLPIYIDLREYTWDKSVDFDLSSILAHILKKSWKGGHASSPISPEDIISHVQENRALMIWDGLDEVIVHMEPKHANDFIRQLWRILPPLKQDKVQNPKAGKMLISCRSHYFRDINQQNSMLTSEHRDGIKGEDYEALILLPFGQNQIETYLGKSLGITGSDLSKSIELISSVHNLPEMAERPYTLSLIAQHIPQIEALSLRGEVIQGVTLYKSMVDNWLARDTGKHQFSPQHKKQLMEYLAAALWRTGQRQWTVDDLDEWLDDFLYENPRIADAYKTMDREVLKEDLRTATFITRPDDEHFRFAHTSLQEFFLASYLHRGLYEKKRENWQLFSEENSALPSNETLDFMAQLYTSEPKRQPKCKQSMVSWLSENDHQSSQLLFKVWLMLTERNEIIPYDKLSFAKTDLSHWQIKGTAQRNLIIHDADFSHAKLDHIVFDYVQFKHCNFNHANLWLAEFQHCQFDSCQFDQTNLRASLWRHNNLTSLTFENCNTTDSQWIDNESQNALWSNNRSRPLGLLDRSKPIEKKLLVHPTLGHNSTVKSTAFSPDGQYFVSGGEDNTVKLWSINIGRCIYTFKGHSDSVNSLAICPEGKHIVSGSRDKTIKLWDINSGRCIHTFHGHTGLVSAVIFSKDGKHIASGAQDKSIKLWDISGNCIHTFEKQYSNLVNSVKFSPDGESLAIGDNKTIKLWNINGQRYTYKLEGHSDSVRSIAFSPDGKHIASGDSTNIRLWDTRKKDCIHIFEGHSSDLVFTEFSPDGKLLISGDDLLSIKTWDINSRYCMNTFKGQRLGVTKNCAIFSDPKGIHTALISHFDNIKLWDINNSSCCINTFEGHSDYVTSITFNPSYNTIASADNGGKIKLWNIENGACTSIFQAHTEIIRSISYSPNGKNIASGSLDNTIKIWNIDSGDCTNTFEGQVDSTNSFAFSPEGDQIVTVGDQNTAKLWCINSEQCIRVFQEHEDTISTVAFNPNGNHIASGSNDNSIKLWEINTGRCIRTYKGHTGSVNTIAFTLDGKLIASGSSDNHIKLWDTSNGYCTYTFNSHSGSISALAFSPDGNYLVSGAHDNVIKLWDIRSGRCIKNFTEHCGGIRSVIFSSDSKHIVSSANDNTIKVWSIDGEKLLRTSYQLPKGNTATIDSQTGKIIYGSKEAWRHFCYKDPAVNILDATLYPAEVYGPLPGSEI